jgi:hypothetical protein
MKKILALFLLTAAALCAQAEKVELGSHGRITLYLDDTWKFETSDFGDRVMVNIAPKGEANASCSFTITFPEQDRLDTKKRLSMRVEVNGQPIADHSVEGKSIAKAFNLQTGYGFYCSFTDPDLIGKPPEKGNFKTISTGMIHLAPDVLIELTISADGFNSEPYQQLLGMIEGMEFTATPSGRKGDKI